ncbi:MAG: MerR family transcriptional regulator [Saprospiraceae bacterium]|jgi:DNA-binding transcriptional MerR regulator|nr:MerR family transcriptional regulator [Saprospiraceae bacterium]MBL0025667.1 MerR family transcriptional regulator [Saprospiraceae bacterium]
METGTLTKLYYPIGEVAEIFDVSPSLIRYWETEFISFKPGKNRKGDRRYTPKDIENLKTIYHLVKERGFTIDGAKKELENQKNESKVKNQLLKKLNSLRSKLVKLKEEKI